MSSIASGKSMMLRRLGYVSTSLSIQARANRTITLRRLTRDRLRELIRANLLGLKEILGFNISHEVLLFRISSQVIPLGGHPANDLNWWDEFAAELSELGHFIRSHDIRVSMHPGQYTLLNSPRMEVVTASVRDLTWHCRFLDAMGLDASHRVITHAGGVYGDKDAALRRWSDNYTHLPDSVQNRLVVENDERLYTVDDLLRLNEATGVPVVFDALHHRLNPGASTGSVGEAMLRCFETWSESDGPPKIHYSSQSPTARQGAHADYIDACEFIEFLKLTPGRIFDCMLEAKAKDLALFRLREALAGAGLAEQAR